MSEQDQMPDRLGPYRLLDRIGEGGMGVVFLARDDQQRSVALKVLRPSVAGESNARRRLAREVETMRLVRSPYVAEVLDADLTGDMPYIVTRYVPGRTLDQVVGESGPLQREELAKLACGLAEALVAVHAAGVVHRDLKPGNVMLVSGAPVVIDFGIAQGADTTRLTTTGMFMGTPGYLAPEVIEGQPSSEASDVHAWGATMAFAATGRPPFGAGPYETIFFRIVHGQPDLAGVPGALLPLLTAALARDPAHRPSTSALSAMATTLDAGQLVPTAPGPGQPGAAIGAPRTQADLAAAGAGPPATPGAAGWAAAPPLGAPQFGGVPVGVDGLPGQPFAGADGAGVQPGTLAMPGGASPDDYADLLPPATYQPASWDGNGHAAGLAAPDGPGLAPAGAPGRRVGARGQLVPVLATVALLAGVSVMFPVVGTAVAMALILALRAGELSHSAAVRRRARGTRGGPAMTAMSFPWFLVRSALVCLGLAPFAAAAGVVAAGISIAAQPGEPLPRAIAFGAGALVAFYGIGPGSSRGRRQLGRLLASATRSTLAQVVAVGGLTVLAVAALAAAVAWPSVFWPVTPPGQLVRVGVAPGSGVFQHFSLVAHYLISHLRL